MKPLTCPQCKQSYGSKVIDTRDKLEIVYRKRKCANCGHVYGTREFVVPARRRKENANWLANEKEAT